ncbi:MAG: hypothetical protein OEV42_15415 [Deltaproteobacteria bacterium]|nr:hypothetical protein [Deltaproteobacteria bacterium]
MLKLSIIVGIINVIILTQLHAPAFSATSYIDSSVWGRWETKPDDKPGIVIDIKRHKRTEVTINGAHIKMEYSVVAGEHNNLLLEFSYVGKLKDQSEVEQVIYLVEGKIGSDFVMTGFFNDILMNIEGVEQQFDIHLITLYLTKRYGPKE